MANSFHSKPISTLHLAWAAGFLEGEGSFSSRGRGSSTVTAAQVQKEPIDRLRALFGGHVYQRFTKGFSSQPIWVWTLPSRRSIQVMMTLYILMSPKRRLQIEEALAMWKAQKRILKPHGSNFCGNGHELTEDNVYLVSGKYRKCRRCRVEAKRALRRRGCLGIAPKKQTYFNRSRGEDSASAKLSNLEVVEIRDALSAGFTQVSIAKRYGVTSTLIGMIKLGKHRANTELQSNDPPAVT